jgi:hypothetical protein
MPITEAEQAIIESVLFASIFDYPLTLAQLRQTLITSRQTPTEILKTSQRSPVVAAAIEERDGFYFPAGQRHLVAERRAREHRSRRFLAAHRTVLSAISALPFVRMVALSGSVAHLNLSGDGDLDLFIVTRGPRVWSVTVAVVLLAKLLGRRRTICANFVVADSALTLEQQDLFAASQIIHLKPLVGHDVYRRFVDLNPFVARLYPNFRLPARVPRDAQSRATRTLKRAVEAVFAAPSLVVERVCRFAYSRYLLRGAAHWQSPEQVRLEVNCLKLHTRSHRGQVIEEFRGQCTKDAAGERL